MIKRKAGRPENCDFNDIDSLKTRAIHEMSKFDAKLINKMDKLYKMLEEIAFAEGEFTKASIQCRKTAIQDLIARGELYTSDEAVLQNQTPKEEEESDDVSSLEDTVVKAVSGSDTNEPTREEKMAQWKALQEKKKLEG